MKLGLGPDSVIPKRFYFVYNVFCFGLMHHYRVSGPRSAKEVAPSKEVPIGNYFCQIRQMKVFREKNKASLDHV